MNATLIASTLLKTAPAAPAAVVVVSVVVVVGNAP
ncbi:ilvB operon leader peptide IvbL [Klebsiella quasivariicola]